MSTSSATTLISPTASTLTNITSSSRPQVQHAASGSSQSIERMQTTGEASASASRPSGSGPVGASVVRRTSSNQGQPHAHGTGHHAVHKRRQGSHSHATHHAHGHGHGQARRSSEGEHGRRAMAAGLAMQSMQPPKARRKGSGDKPFRTNSRSETNLPRLSRVNSDASHKSTSSRPTSRQSSRHSSPSRPHPPNRQRSVVLDSAGKETAEVNSDEEEWEEEEEGGSAKKQSARTHGSSSDMRRTVSDSHAKPPMFRKITSVSDTAVSDAEASGSGVKEPGDVHGVDDGERERDTDSGADTDRPSLRTRKTTGFAGTHTVPDPSASTPAHALNDPTHVMPAHQIKHQQSARSLHAMTEGRRRKDSKDSVRAPSVGAHSRTGSTDGSGPKRQESGLSMTRTRTPDGLRSLTSSRAVSPDATKDAGTAGRKSAATDGHRDTGASESSIRYDETDRIAPDPTGDDPRTSPSFPFPKGGRVLPADEGEEHAAIGQEELAESPEEIQREGGSGFDQQEMPPPPVPESRLHESTSSRRHASRERERDDRRHRRDRSPRRERKPFPPSSGPSESSATDQRSFDASQAQPSAGPSISNPSDTPVEPRSRQTSGRLRHRYSNSSLRSIQSLRAPPHPLNSPTGYRSHMSAAALGSPVRSKAPSMHYPPVAPPVINPEQAEGHSWEIPEHAESQPLSPTTPSGSTRNGRSSTRTLVQPQARLPRSSSFASVRSFTSMITGTGKGTATGDFVTGNTVNGDDVKPTPHRRTALEATSKAAKYRTTTNAAEYHSSLGYPSTSAETAHLISRFLPQKRVQRPLWDIRADSYMNPEGEVGGDGGNHDRPRIGLTNGDYRDAHEGLIRTMRAMGLGTSAATGGAAGAGAAVGGAGAGAGGVARRGMSMVGRAPSYGGASGLLGLTQGSGGGTGAGAVGAGIGAGAGAAQGVGQGQGGRDEIAAGAGAGLGLVRGKSGNLVVGKGGWNGRTPFELSVDRCLVQRPRGVGGAGF